MSIASGGRVWNLPGLKEDAPVNTKNKRGMSSYITYLMFVIFPVSLVSLSIQCYTNHITNEARVGANSGGAVGDGYNFVNSVNLVALGISFAVILLLSVGSALFYVLKSNVTDQKPLKMTVAFIILAMLIFGPIVAKNFIVPFQSSNIQNFSEWAKEKYSLSKLESYESNKTSLDARDITGEKVKMYIYRSPENLVYLYRSEEELQKILTNNIATKTQNDTK